MATSRFAWKYTKLSQRENPVLGKNQENDGGARDCAVDQVNNGCGD